MQDIGFIVESKNLSFTLRLSGHFLNRCGIKSLCYAPSWTHGFRYILGGFVNSFQQFVVFALICNSGITSAIGETLTAPVESQVIVEQSQGQTTYKTKNAANSNVVSGQIIVKYKPSVTAPVEQIIGLKKRFKDFTTDNSSSLDQLYQRFQVSSATPLFRPPIKNTTAVGAMVDILNQQRAKLASIKNKNPAKAARMRPQAVLPELSHVYLLKLPLSVKAKEAVAEFQRDPHVEYAQVNYTVEPQMLPNDPYYASTGAWGQVEDDLWGLKKIAMEQAWDISQGKNVVVAVVDTGVDASHVDIAANMWANVDEIPDNGVDDDLNGYVDDVYGWNFAANNNNPTDGYGHGTHVAGTIAAVGNNSVGVIGVAPQAKIMAMKGLGDTGSGYISDLANAIVYAAENGADVINNSWGCSSPCPSDPLAEDAVRYAYGLGSVVVFAAGNASADVADYSPQNIPESVTVGATTQTDVKSSFSNYGQIDVTAPGGGNSVSGPVDSFRNILSLKSTICYVGMCPGYLLVGTDYVRQAGTSMAAPHVSGLAALVLAQHPAYTQEQVRQVLRRGADDIYALGFDQWSGYGRINAFNTLQEPTPLEARITGIAPVFNATTSEITVNGMAQGPGFSDWVLEYGAGTNPVLWNTLAQSTMPVDVPGLLTIWDASTLPDGTYMIRLRANNTLGEHYDDHRKLVVDQVKITSPDQQSPQIYSGGDVIYITGMAAPTNFGSYTIKVYDSNDVELTDAAITLVNNGQQKVFDGVLGSWDTAGVGADYYTIWLRVNLVGGGFITEITKVIVDPTLHEGWPVSIGTVSAGGGSFMSVLDHVAAADATGDGNKEIAVAYGADEVLLFDHNGHMVPGWPQSVGVGQLAQFGPAMGDLDGDGIAEIIATDRNDIFAWKGDGTLLPGWPQYSRSYKVTIADVDNNGRNDVISLTDGGQIFVRDYQGNFLPGWPVNLAVGGGSFISYAAVGDLDNNGDNELVVLQMSTPYNLFVLNSDGSMASGWPIQVNPAAVGASIFSYPVIGNIDDDADLEIIALDSDGNVHAFNPDATPVTGWPQSTPSGFSGPPAIGDIDGDGKPEIVAGNSLFYTGSGYVSRLWAWHSDGAVVSGWPIEIAPWRYFAYGFTSPIIADIDGDGLSEVVAGGSITSTNKRALYAFNHDGSAVDTFPKPTVTLSAAPSNTAAVTDIDNNGDLELLWLDIDNNLYVWDLDSTSNMPQPWPMMLHDAAHMGRFYKDSDNDAIVDDNDNCLLAPNNAQQDADGDGFGNMCDPDFNNDGIVNAADLAYMKANFFSSDAEADLNSDGFVNAADLAILKPMFFGPPGPSGLVEIP